MKLPNEAEYMAATGFTLHPTIACRSGLGPYMAHRANASGNLMIATGWKQRAPENFADLVIFDPASIADTGTYENPQQYSARIRF